MKLPFELSNPLRIFLHMGLIAGVAWVAIRAISVLGDYLVVTYRVDMADNLRSRQILTQFRIIRMVTTLVVLVLAMGLMLMSFETMRQFGVTMPASAGDAG